jgi:hypothetical protein
MRVSVLWNSSVFSSRGPRLVETLNKKCSKTYSRLRFCFRLLVAALLEEVKKKRKIH